MLDNTTTYNNNIKKHLLEVEYGILGVVALKTWKLNHQIKKVGMLLQSLVDYLNLSERQSIQPIHFRQMSVAMFLTQLTWKQQYHTSYLELSHTFCFAGHSGTKLQTSKTFYKRWRHMNMNHLWTLNKLAHSWQTRTLLSHWNQHTTESRKLELAKAVTVNGTGLMCVQYITLTHC